MKNILFKTLLKTFVFVFN